MIVPGLLTAADRASSTVSSSSLSAPRSRSSHSNTRNTTATLIAGAGPPDAHPEFIFDASQLPCTPPERPDLRELNNSLEALAAVFPDIQIEVFRELLSHFDGESRLALVADALLKNRVAWVKGRWRAIDPEDESQVGVLPRAEAFRSKEYRDAVQALALGEFKGLSRSTIRGVLAESNYSYLEARKTLVALSFKSWRFTLSSLFLRRKPVATGEAENHPLVVWRSTGQGSIIPTIRATGHAELDRELYDRLVVPLKTRDREEREAKDRGLAVILNNEEAEEAGAAHECSCCFATGAFEEFTHCNREGHMICFRCVQHSITEALFGQGWLSSINAETGSLRCMAVDGDGCSGCVSAEHIRRAMLEQKNGAELLHKLDQRLAEHSLLASRVPLVRCPFCSYAEVDDIYMPSGGGSRRRIKLDSAYNLFFIAVCAGSLPFLFPLVLLSAILCIFLSSQRSLGDQLVVEWGRALNRHSRRRRGLKFSCQNLQCRRVSCLSCSKPWVDVHICHESSLVALRTQVEQAMSMAIKRVCPRCSTSFVKNSGCNKLTCPCGYKMCYVCRADLSEEGYRHFCDHFRPDGDPRPCKECDRCNLWESEDTDLVLQAAREEAERKWKAAENRDLSGAERDFVETGVARKKRDSPLGKVFYSGKCPSLADCFDVVVETIFV
jgi:hypothetical protein